MEEKLAHVYVITRRDIPAPHLSVQIAHAAVAAANTFKIASGHHPNLVVCAVANERELEAAFNRLKEQGVPVLAWMEEDMDKELTAICTAELRGDARKPLRRFRLL